MSIKKGLFLALFLTIFLAGVSANAATAGNRYLVKSNSNFWKKSFVVRNSFDGSFTADLSTLQLKMAKLFGVDIQPVKTLNILSATPTPSPTPKVVAKSKTPAAPVAWGVSYVYGNNLKDGDLPSGGDGVTVAILDTGVNKNHPDLKDRITDCADFSSAANLVKGQCDDNNGHGTSVAGIVAADGGTGAGIYGVAPSANLDIYKVCGDDGTCFADDVAAAIRYATDQKANIILISIGSDVESQLVTDAINYASSKGVMVVAAAGNDGPDSGGIDFPAAQASVVSVAALDVKSNVPDWSSRGSNETSKPLVKETGDVEFAAPGVNVESTGKDGDYVTSSGTSMAAAHVAGLAAKEWQATAKDPIAATRDILHKFSQDIGALGDDNSSGWGVPIL